MIAMKKAEARSRNQKGNSGLSMDGRLKLSVEKLQC